MKWTISVDDGEYDGEQRPKRVKEDETGERSLGFTDFGSLLESGSFSDVDVVLNEGEEGSFTFKLHKVILAHNSGYFRACLKSDTFLESRTNRVDLIGYEPAQIRYMLYWLYNGKAPKPQQAKQTFTLPFLLACIKTALYFDIPSMKTAVIKDCVAQLRRTRYQRHYSSGGKLESSFIRGVQILFNIFPTQATTLDCVIHAVCTNGWIPLIMGQRDLRQSIKSFPELMQKTIEIQAGMEAYRGNDDESQYDESSEALNYESESANVENRE